MEGVNYFRCGRKMCVIFVRERAAVTHVDLEMGGL